MSNMRHWFGQTDITVNTRDISGMLLRFKETANQALRKLNLKQEPSLICGLVACPVLCCDWSQHIIT